MAGVPGQRPVLADPPPGHAGGGRGVHRDRRPGRGGRRRAGRELAGPALAPAQGARARRRWRSRRARRPARRRRAWCARSRSRPERPTGKASSCRRSGLRADLGAPLIDRPGGRQAGRARGPPGRRPHRRDRPVPVRSPSDVAARPTRSRAPRSCSASSATARAEDVTVTPEALEQNGRVVGIAGVRLKVDPASRPSASASRSATVRSRRWGRARARPGSSRSSR